jgi:hypothetical protein
MSKINVLWDKFKAIFGSIRFWQVTLGLALGLIYYYGYIPKEIAELLGGWLGIQVLIRSLDKFRK